MNSEIKEIQIINRGKIAFLSMNSIFEERIEKINRHGIEQYAYTYMNTETLAALLRDYDEPVQTINLKLYNSCFKNIAYEIKKYKVMNDDL